MSKRKGPASLTARTLAAIRVAYELDASNPKFVSIDARDSDDDTLLHRAVFRGDRRDVQDLLVLGANVRTHGDLGYTALHYAAMQGHREIAELLLAAGADPAATDEQGHVPALTAELAGNAEIARLLRSPRGWQRVVSG
ncbi:ankyrin repeat domain-containing protein [Phenylobacterium sp.]|uniref:ankyrin repeat domain-containing protein n=1 Tax=Phenylobacterium sp. TaxID=1871053 RepID=UPI0025DAB08B|nr:ankyrin repeat domain-containing protein [Phenylobacterium sp.]